MTLKEYVEQLQTVMETNPEYADFELYKSVDSFSMGYTEFDGDFILGLKYKDKIIPIVEESKIINPSLIIIF